MGIMNTRFSNTVLTASTLQDLILWILLNAATRIATTGEVKFLDMLADANLHRALEDDVELLTRVGRRGNGLVQERGVVLVGDPVWSAEAVLEHRRLVADVHVRLVRRQGALPRARHFIAGKVGAMALQKRIDVDAKGNRALVEKVERRVELPRLDRLVVLDGDFRLLRHLLNRLPDDLAHLAYARSHLNQIFLRLCTHFRYFSDKISEYYIIFFTWTGPTCGIRE